MIVSRYLSRELRAAEQAIYSNCKNKIYVILRTRNRYWVIKTVTKQTQYGAW